MRTLSRVGIHEKVCPRLYLDSSDRIIPWIPCKEQFFKLPQYTAHRLTCMDLVCDKCGKDFRTEVDQTNVKGHHVVFQRAKRKWLNVFWSTKVERKLEILSRRMETLNKRWEKSNSDPPERPLNLEKMSTFKFWKIFEISRVKGRFWNRAETGHIDVGDGCWRRSILVTSFANSTMLPTSRWNLLFPRFSSN